MKTKQRLSKETYTLRLDEDLVQYLEKDAERYRATIAEIVRQVLLSKYGLVDGEAYPDLGKK